MFPTDRLAALLSDAIAQDGRRCLQYGLTAGELDLRELLARHHGGVEPDRVVVTTGSQQGLDLLSRCLIDPGDVVVCSDPDYLGALQAFRAAGAQLEPIPVDHDGMRVEVLERKLELGLRPKLAYVVPNFHNPTGGSLGLLRRIRLEQLAASHGFVVAEDDPYRELRYDGEIVSPGAPAPNVVHLGSVSKILAPGLRVGWMVGPDWLMDAVEVAKQGCDLHTSTLGQAAVAASWTAPWWPEHLDSLRAHYRAKRDRFVDELTSQLGDQLSFVAPEGGMFVWASVDDTTVDTTQQLAVALQNGVCFVPGAAFAVDRLASNRLRLSFATLADGEITEAVARLARSLHRMVDTTPMSQPDDKDWTWVLETVCPECGFDASHVDRSAVAQMIRDNAAEWVELLTGDPAVLRRRPTADRWSPLEYAFHVRDVFELYDYRLSLMLEQDGPHYPNWDQDETAVEKNYNAAEPSVVAAELAAEAEKLASRFDGVQGAQWERTGFRSDGAAFTVESFARYLIHDPIHHLWDARP